MRHLSLEAAAGTAAPFASFSDMIALTITLAGYEALKIIRPGTYEAAAGADGLIRIWLDRKFVERLRQLRRPDESYSDVILRLAKGAP